MAELRGLPKAQPDLTYLMNLQQENSLAALNSHCIGKILEFDKDTQTCTVQLMQLKQFGSTTYTPVPITQVPLLIYGAGGGLITLPNPVGTICLLLFFDRNIDAFMKTGEMYAPETTRMHDFTDCIAITTFTTLVNPIENYDDEAITVIYQKIVSEVLYTAVIKNTGNAIQLKVSTDDNTSQVIISDKINIQNTAQNLMTLIEELIADIKDLSINTVSGTINQTSIDTLDETADKFRELLE